MEQLLFAHLGKSTLSASESGGAFAWSKIIGGEDIKLSLRFVAEQAGQTLQVQRTVHAVKASLGRQQMAAEDGNFTLKLGSDTEAAGVNTTSKLAYNISAADLATALNALTDAALADAKPFEVTFREGSYFIAAADRSAVIFSCVDNELWPGSKVYVASQDFDEGIGYELRLNQVPVAQTATFDTVVPAVPTMTQIRAGATNSGVLTTELQQLFMPPENPPGFSFVLKRGYRKTDVIVVAGPWLASDAALSTNLAKLLNAKATATSSGFADEGETFIVYPAANGVIIEFAGDLAGVNQDLLEIEVVAEAPADPVLNLSTKTPLMATLLRKVNAQTKEIAAVLHLTVWLVDEQNGSLYREHNYHVQLTLIAPVNMDDLIAASDLNWASPLSRESWKQFSPTQLINTPLGYLLHDTTALGDGTTTVFNVTHNLGTTYIQPSLYNAADDDNLMVPGVDYRIRPLSDNESELTFISAPGAGEITGGLSTVASTNAFVDLEITQSQVIGLEDRLDGIEAALALLLASAAVGSGGTRDPSAGTLIAEQVFRPIVEAYPLGLDLTAALASVQTAAASTTSTSSTTSNATGGVAAINAAADIPQDVLAKFGSANILGAIHDSVAEALPSPKPSANAANKGKIYQNRGLAAVRLNGDGRRDGYMLQPGEFCGCDGRALYALTAPGVPNGAFAFTVPDHTNDTLIIPGVKLPNGTPVMCKSDDTLPAGCGAALTQRYVINTALGSCKLSATVGGGALDLTDAGTGTHYIFATAGSTTSFFPRDFERQLFITHVSESKLRVKGKLEARIGFESAMLSVDTAAGRFGQKITQGRWRIVMRIGTDLAESVPATTRSNLKRIVWQDEPILDELVYVARDVAEIHTFGARIKRTAADAWTIEKCVNGFWFESDATLDTANFWLTAELIEWDCEDAPDPEGIVVLLGLDKTNAKSDSGIGKIQFT